MQSGLEFALNDPSSVKFPGLDELFEEEEDGETKNQAKDEYKPRIMTLWSRSKIGTLQSRLDKLQNRMPGKFNYSNLVIMKLANDVFGFQGWSTHLVSVEADLINSLEGSMDENKYSVAATAIVRITLKDGTFYETQAVGKSHNLPEKGSAYRLAKMLAVTLATKLGILELPILTIDDEAEYGPTVIKQEVKPEIVL